MVANGLIAMAALQVALGITTLVLVVPVHAAATHQAGAVLLFTLILWFTHELRGSS
jgi:cytochrome c oxidase assembly protein subunit 15